MLCALISTAAQAERKVSVDNNECTSLKGRSLYAYVNFDATPSSKSTAGNHLTPMTIKKTNIEFTDVILSNYYEYDGEAIYKMVGQFDNGPFDNDTSECVADLRQGGRLVGLEIGTISMRMIWREGMSRYIGKTADGRKFSATVSKD